MYSIIVPVYKVEKYLPECVDSILAQTYKDFEVILVDDGSPDNCPVICDEYAQKDSRVKVVHKPNGGLVSARKAGIENAAGEYICFVDGDDFISCDMLEQFDELLAENDYDVICTNYVKYFGEDSVAPMNKNIILGSYDKKSLTENVYPKMLSASPFFQFGVIPGVCTKCIKKSILHKAYEDMPDEISLGEDVAVTYLAMLEADLVYFSDYCGYMYRQNSESMTHKYDENLYKKIKKLILRIKNVRDRTGWKDAGQIDRYITFLLINAKNNEFKYNFDDTYRNKKRNMLKYLNDPIFKSAIKNVSVNGIRNKILLLCFKTHFMLPIHLYEMIVQRKNCNE